MGPVVVLDANAIWGAGLRDLLLNLAEETEAFQPRWTSQILEEVTRNVLRVRTHLTADQMAYLVSEMNRAFPEALVTGHDPLISQMTNDPGDRHVLAAAVHVGAELILTFDLDHFKDSACRPHGVRAVSPDAFLCDLFDAQPREVIATLEVQAGDIDRGIDDVLVNLDKSVPRFVAKVRAALP